MMKKFLADRFSGSNIGATKRTQMTPSGAMEVDNDAPMVLLGLRHMDADEQEQISSVGSSSSLADQIKSLSSSIGGHTSAAATSSVLDMFSMQSHGDTRPSHGVFGLPTQAPRGPASSTVRKSGGIDAAAPGITASSAAAMSAFGGRGKKGTAANNDDVIADFIHGFDRSRFIRGGGGGAASSTRPAVGGGAGGVAVSVSGAGAGASSDGAAGVGATLKQTTRVMDTAVKGLRAHEVRGPAAPSSSTCYIVVWRYFLALNSSHRFLPCL